MGYCQGLVAGPERQATPAGHQDRAVGERALHLAPGRGGDSGGPLVIEKDGAWQLVGLGSWITAVPEHALEAGFYGQVVYNVRVSRYIDWIESIIERDASL